MHNASNTQTAASTFNTNIVNISNALLSFDPSQTSSLTDAALLEAIGHMAFSMAQEIRVQHAQDEVALDKMEQEDADAQDVAWQSDALDHSCEGGEDRHLDGYWESLTDIGDVGDCCDYGCE